MTISDNADINGTDIEHLLSQNIIHWKDIQYMDNYKLVIFQKP